MGEWETMGEEAFNQLVGSGDDESSGPPELTDNSDSPPLSVRKNSWSDSSTTASAPPRESSSSVRVGGEPSRGR